MYTSTTANDETVRYVSHLLISLPHFTHLLLQKNANAKQTTELRKRSPLLAPAAAAVPFAKRPFLQKYVVVNTGLFECFIVLLVVAFVTVVAVNVLANVQTPDRFESPSSNKN
jgi:hypothetical protein